MSIQRTLSTVAAMILVVVACGEPATDSATTTSDGSVSSTTVPEFTSTTSPPPGDDLFPGQEIPEGAESVVETAIADLAERLGVGADTVGIIGVQEMTWSDGSLDCPEPGMSYTQALVEGYWILLNGNGRAYDYRATENGFVKLCESAVSPTTAPSS
jgi:hypothetical protein